MRDLLWSTNFRVLTVCTGNIWRSPSAALLLADALGTAVRASSAGTRAVVGEPIDYGAELRLRRRGLTGDGVTARQLTASTLHGQDLVLALTRAHRDDLLGLRGARPARTFTLLELARIVDAPGFPALPSGSVRRRMAAMAQAAHDHRHLGVTRHNDDVPDPFGQPPPVMDASFALIVDAVDTIARVAHGLPRSGPGQPPSIAVEKTGVEP